MLNTGSEYTHPLLVISCVATMAGLVPNKGFSVEQLQQLLINNNQLINNIISAQNSNGHSIHLNNTDMGDSAVLNNVLSQAQLGLQDIHSTASTIRVNSRVSIPANCAPMTVNTRALDPPIVSVPVDSTPVFDINFNDFVGTVSVGKEPEPEKIAMQPQQAGSSSMKDNYDPLLGTSKRKMPGDEEQLGSSKRKEGGKKKNKKARSNEELNTPPPTPSYNNVLSCETVPVRSPSSVSSASPLSSTYAEEDEELNQILEDYDFTGNEGGNEVTGNDEEGDVTDNEEVEVTGNEVGEVTANGEGIYPNNDYSELFVEDDSFTVNGLEALRRSLKFQTYLRPEDRFDPLKFGSFILEFSEKMKAVNVFRMEAHKSIDKEYNCLFNALLASHFSKWTGIQFCHESERKKKNVLEIIIKNFDTRILGKAKILKGNKKKS